MSKPRSRASSSLEAAKRLPWAAIAGVAVATGKRWRTLSERERSRLLALVRESGVRPDRLSEKQRKELRKLLAKLDLRGLSGDVARLAGGVRKRGRRRS